MKRDRLLALVDLVGADVLGDSARLARHDLGLADRVEEGGLAVVDVAHDRHDGRALLEIALFVFEDDLLGLLLGGRDHLDLAVKRLSDDHHGLVGERLRKRRHLAHRHQRLDDFGAGEPEGLSDLLDGGTRRDLDRRLDLLGGRRRAAALRAMGGGGGLRAGAARAAGAAAPSSRAAKLVSR